MKVREYMSLNSIRESILQSSKPEKIIKDYRGTLIQPGLKVAYNYQGSVRLGEIVEYESDWKRERDGWEGKFWWRCKFLLKIQSDTGTISKVRNPNSFVIIEGEVL